MVNLNKTNVVETLSHLTGEMISGKFLIKRFYSQKPCIVFEVLQITISHGSTGTSTWLQPVAEVFGRMFVITGIFVKGGC